MTRKADFNAEDWSIVVEGPMYAGMRVIAAERGGTVRELAAMSRVYQEARAQAGHSTLLDAIVTSPVSLDGERIRQAGDQLSAITTGHLRRAMSILETAASPEEVDDYKRFVMTVAQTVAGAHREGGFLGFGGSEVSAAEDAALDEISLALGAPPRDATDPAPAD